MAPSARRSTTLAKAASISLSLLAFRTSSSSPSAPEAARTSVVWGSEAGFPGLINKPITVPLGTILRSSSSRFAASAANNAREIAVGAVETGNEAKIDRIGASCEYDRNGGGCSLGCQRSRRGDRNDHARRVGHQFGRQRRQLLEATIGRKIFDRNISAFDIAGLLEALPDRPELAIIKLGAAQQAHERHRRLLRARRERPCNCRAAEQRYERAALHSNISSARPDRGSGTAMPSALAVLRLMKSSTLVACWTGRSAGFSPLRTRPV